MQRIQFASAVLAVAVGLGGCATLPKATYQGDRERVARMLREDDGVATARFDDGGCSGCTLLHFAAGGDHAEIAAMLLEHGADVNATDSRGLTPLHVASTNQHPRTVEYLLGHGATPALSMRDTWGSTPLLLSVGHTFEREQSRSVELVRVLTRAGASVADRTPQGNTPLHIAAYKGFDAVIDALLAAGADRESLNEKGETAEDLARRFNRAAVVRLLEHR
jgi:ankyrin repeat protein